MVVHGHSRMDGNHCLTFWLPLICVVHRDKRRRKAKTRSEDCSSLLAATTRILPSARDCPVTADGDVHLVWAPGFLRLPPSAFRPPPSALRSLPPLRNLRSLASCPLVSTSRTRRANSLQRRCCWLAGAFQRRTTSSGFAGPFTVSGLTDYSLAILARTGHAGGSALLCLPHALAPQPAYINASARR